MKTVQIAVRDFALPCPRRGGIDVHSGYSLISQGQEIHDYVQQKRKKESPYYKAEVKITNSFEREGYKFVVGGRIDGVFDGFPVLIEEIKSTVNIHQLKAKLELCPDHPYVLQVLTYAYLYFLQTGVKPNARLFLVSSTNYQQTETLDLTLDQTEYEAWMEKRLAELVIEMQTIEADVMRRIDISANLNFPFDKPRQGQIDLMASVERSIGNGKQLMVQAATGLGKTMAITFPSLKNALSRGQKLIYVTPKNSQHSVAEEALEHLTKDGQPLHTLTLTAKSKICFKPEPICTPEYCEYARDYYEKVDKHNLINVMATKPHLNFETLQKLGKEFEVCPFELSVDAIGRADVVVGDYNYVFSPRSLMGRFTQLSDLLQQKPNLVIDEAHNLPDRACDYYSPSISTLTMEDGIAATKLLSPSLAIEAQAILHRSIGIIESAADMTKREAEIKLDVSKFKEQDGRWKEFLAQYLQSGQVVENRDAVVRAANAWSQFTEGIEVDSEHFFITSRRNRGIEIKVTCCDASSFLRDTYEKFSSAIGFSATLKPFDYYTRLSGFDAELTETVECLSPFPRENRKLLVIPQVSTKYSDRARNYDKISDAIKRIVNLKRGNYFAFFPSFEFLNEVASRTSPEDFNILQQRNDMKSDEVREWIDRLKAQTADAKPTLIFAVQGGVFSEGVDYPGDSLIGAFIIGPALPKFDLERELLRAYYEKHYKAGFDYAYTFPAMSRVVQSAGRVIRSENDKGIIVLMDQRFTHKSYVGAMPADWFSTSVSELVSSSIIKDISHFWAQEKASTTP